jgi:hypothetical protein
MNDYRPVSGINKALRRLSRPIPWPIVPALRTVRSRFMTVTEVNSAVTLSYM